MYRSVTTIAVEPDRAELERSRTLMERNLRLLHDVLARTPMAGRYWLFGGLLLSAVREGEIMLHDTKDADFGQRGADVPTLVSAFPALVEAGFAPYYRFPGAFGPAHEYSFKKDDAKFEFFVTEVEAGRLTWRNCGHRAGVPILNRCAIPAQPLDEIRFVGRTWLKAADVDVELTALYGDWRTPAPGFAYMEAPTIVSRHPWQETTFMRWAEVYPVTGC
jgi:hypothetical protein